MKLAIEILKREIAQRELAQKHNHLRKEEIDLELKSLNKAVEKLTIPLVCQHEYIFNPFINGQWCRLCHNDKPEHTDYK